LKDIYDEEKYAKSKYEKTNHKFGSITGIFSFTIMLLMLIFGGFGWLDNVVK